MNIADRTDQTPPHTLFYLRRLLKPHVPPGTMSVVGEEPYHENYTPNAYNEFRRPKFGPQNSGYTGRADKGAPSQAPSGNPQRTFLDYSGTMKLLPSDPFVCNGFYTGSAGDFMNCPGWGPDPNIKWFTDSEGFTVFAIQTDKCIATQ